MNDWLPRVICAAFGVGLSLTCLGLGWVAQGRLCGLAAGLIGALAPYPVTVSRQVLGEFGNMSSATILFILDRLRKQNAPRPCVALGFGPGQFGLYLLGIGQALSDLLTPHFQHLEDWSIGEAVKDKAHDAEAGYLGEQLRPV